MLLQVAFAEELLKQHLTVAAEELISLSNSTVTQNGVTQKNQYFSLLYRIVACMEGLQSCLPDFAAPAGITSSPGTSLVATGQVLCQQNVFTILCPMHVCPTPSYPLHAYHVTMCSGSLSVKTSVWLIDMPLTMMIRAVDVCGAAHFLRPPAGWCKSRQSTR